MKAQREQRREQEEERSRNLRHRVVRAIRALPSGKVSTYGAIARAAGWAGAARQVVSILRRVPGLPWHRVLGAGGAIKLTGESGAEQRFRLQMEGVAFRGLRVDMKRHEFHSPPASRGHAVGKSNRSKPAKPKRPRRNP
jgi:methylated-DNA-protein-cysteine methyltransferase-like protein